MFGAAENRRKPQKIAGSSFVDPFLPFSLAHSALPKNRPWKGPNQPRKGPISRKDFPSDFLRTFGPEAPVSLEHYGNRSFSANRFARITPISRCESPGHLSFLSTEGSSFRPSLLDGQGPLTGGFQTGGLPDLDLSFLFCPFLSFFVLFFGIFPICPKTLGDFAIGPFPLSWPINSTHEKQSRKGPPRHNLDLSRKSGKPPGLEPPSLASLKMVSLRTRAQHQLDQLFL